MIEDHEFLFSLTKVARLNFGFLDYCKLVKIFREVSPIEKEIFTNLQVFKNFYYQNRRWGNYLIGQHQKTFTEHLAQKLKYLKELPSEIRDLRKGENWKKFLNESIASIKNLKENDKEKIIQIINKENISNQERKNLILLLSKLDTDQLIEIFGVSFKLHTKNYIKWGWDFYRYIKIKMLEDYFSIKEKINKFNYKAVDFLNEIKIELAPLISTKEIYAGKVKNRVLSKLFGETESHVKSKISDKTEISLEQLQSYLSNLKASLKKKGRDIPHNILLLFEKYKNENTLRQYTYGSILDKHPDFNLNYFKKIDTKEKAYWLGWLYAEGWLSQIKHEGYPYIEWGVGCNKKDEILLIRFIEAIGFNPKYVEYDNLKKGFVRIRISFSRMDFPNTLIELGWNIGKKSHCIKLPDFKNINKNRQLYLAFLLGFFDGDGETGTSQIDSKSKRFLENIKNKFNIKYEVRQIKNKDGIYWRLTLGAELFNEMLDNYQKSLPSKRIRLEEHQERMERLRNFAQSRQKFMFTKEQLEQLVWYMTYEEIADLHFEIFKVKITKKK